MKRFVVCFIVATFTAAYAVKLSTTNTSFLCKDDRTGQFSDPVQCDKFYECDDGIATEKLCPDGLVFDVTSKLVNRCDQPFNVDCGNRTELQEPKSKNDKCPRKNGFFAHPNPSVCNVFYNCIDDDAIEMTCTTGLHFDEYSGTCVWPDTANREGCKTAEEISKETNDDGFNCPTVSIKTADTRGQTIAHPRFAHPEDCTKFYVCLNGVEKRELTCELGLVYHEEKSHCEEPKNVPGCEDWYKSDSKGSKSKDDE